MTSTDMSGDVRAGLAQWTPDQIAELHTLSGGGWLVMIVF